MYNIKDLNGPLPGRIIHRETLLGALEDMPQCSQFLQILKSLPISALYNDEQADFTIFVPVNNEIAGKLPVHSYYEARQFILLHSLEHAVSLSFLRSSMGMLLNTRLSGSRVLCEFQRGMQAPLLNRSSSILGYRQVANANIFVIDLPLALDNNPLANPDI